MGKFYKVQADGSLVPVEGTGLLDNIETIIANKTLTTEESGKTILVGTDALVITLPLGVKGVEYTFINIAADGGAIITISPNSADGMVGTIANAAADSVAGGVADKDWINTKATANKGDRCTLISDGGNIWFIKDGVGIWVSE